MQRGRFGHFHNEAMNLPIFRSLSVKLTLAFIGVGLITLISVALIVEQQTQRDFNRATSVSLPTSTMERPRLWTSSSNKPELSRSTRRLMSA